VFGYEHVTLGRLTLSGGARYDHKGQDADANTQLAMSEDSRTYSMLSGSVGGVLALGGGASFVANYGTGWRPPTLFDLYANGPHAAEARYERGDPTLNSELSRNVEGGFRYARSRVRADLLMFQSDFDNFIYTKAAGTVISSLPVYDHVQADARLRGLELTAEAAVNDAMTLRARHEMVEGDNVEDGGYLPLMPPMRTVAGAEVNLGRTAAAMGIRLGAEVEHVVRQNRLGPGDVATDGYTLLNLDAETERMLLPGWHRSVRLSLDVRNVTNVAYRNFLSRYKLFAEDPGINMVIRLSTEW
jgi:outer membrane receptor protein involved in Fe transport